MNRKKRRSAKAAACHQPELTVRVHEAGHCVGRVLVAVSLGRSVYEAIDRIDIPLGAAEATTWGHLLSKPMQDFLQSRMPAKFRNLEQIEHAQVAALAPEMRAAGIDLPWWFQAKSIELIFGPMAEARLLSKPFDDVWNADTSEGDIFGLVSAGSLCGMSIDEIAEATSGNIQIVEGLLATRPELWRAITALADTFTFGRNDGRKAVDIIMSVLSEQGSVPQLTP
jgi:hypothetical protein